MSNTGDKHDKQSDFIDNSATSNTEKRVDDDPAEEQFPICCVLIKSENFYEESTSEKSSPERGLVKTEKDDSDEEIIRQEGDFERSNRYEGNKKRVFNVNSFQSSVDSICNVRESTVPNLSVITESGCTVPIKREILTDNEYENEMEPSEKADNVSISDIPRNTVSRNLNERNVVTQNLSDNVDHSHKNKCDECLKEFNSRSSLARHRRVHKKESASSSDKKKNKNKKENMQKRKNKKTLSKCNSSVGPFSKKTDFINRGTRYRNDSNDTTNCFSNNTDKSIVEKGFERVDGYESDKRESDSENPLGQIENYDLRGGIVIKKEDIEICEDVKGDDVFDDLSIPEKKIYSCGECGKGFPDYRQMLKHEKGHEYRRKSASKRKEYFANQSRHVCKVCGRSYSFYFNMKKHMKSHETEGIFYNCNECSKSFKTEASLSVHKTIHNGTKPYKCNYCPKSYILKFSLINHLRSHTGELPFVCTDCGKAFKIRETLMRHQVVHMTENLFECEVCFKSFPLKISLQTHRKIHYGIKKYCCDYCQRFFLEKGTLRKHIIIHMGVKKFKCQMCDMSFVERYGLVSHTLVHTKEKPHCCNECGSVFSRKMHLKRHERMHISQKSTSVGKKTRD